MSRTQKLTRRQMLAAAALSALGVSGCERTFETRAKPGNATEQNKNKANVIARTTGETKIFAFDDYSVKFLASGEDTGNAFGLIETTEIPGFKTPLHRHNHMDESFYVLGGVLTMKIAERIYEFSAGSYAFVPRGTTHAQANFGTTPIKTLITVAPGGFERFFRDRVEISKTIKPDNPEYMKKGIEALMKYDIEILGDWDVEK